MNDIRIGLILILLFFQIGALINWFIKRKDFLQKKRWQKYNFFLFLGILGLMLIYPNAWSAPQPKTTVKIIKKTVGQKQLAQAKDKYELLSQQQDDLEKQNKQINQQIDELKAKESSLAQSSSLAASLAASMQNQVAQAKKQEQQTQTSSSQAQNTAEIQTDQQPKIVGNINSKIYHTPDQAGYKMNAANAVYFNTEQEAQAAGYRKAKR